MRQESRAGVVNALSPNSIISLVSFSTDVITHFEGVKPDDNQRRLALTAIDELAPRDNTNLGAGWMKGAECLARVMEHLYQHAQPCHSPFRWSRQLWCH